MKLKYIKQFNQVDFLGLGLVILIIYFKGSMNDKIIKSLEELMVLIGGVTEKVKQETKHKETDFLELP